jgi:hypothetical protein
MSWLFSVAETDCLMKKGLVWLMVLKAGKSKSTVPVSVCFWCHSKLLWKAGWQVGACLREKGLTPSAALSPWWGCHPISCSPLARSTSQHWQQGINHLNT